MNSHQSESGIPLLTEVIVTPVYGVDLPERRIALQPMPIAETAPGVEPGGALDAATLARIEREVAERVLQQLMGRIDFVLEQRIRDSLADVLQTAVDGLAGQVRFGLQETLEGAVARAINQEMKKLQSSKK